MMDNRVSSARKRTQVCPPTFDVIVRRLIFAAWELTELKFLTGTPLATLLNQSSTAANLSLSSIPAPDPRTSEDCLFLDVMVPKKIYDKRVKEHEREDECCDCAPGQGKGGEYSRMRFV